MSSKVIFRGRVLIVIIAFTVIASAGLIYSSIKSLQLDREHLTLEKHSKNIVVEISSSRIFLDDYFLFNDTLKKVAVLNCFTYTNEYINALDSFIVKKYKGNQEFDFRKTLESVNNQVTQLHKQIAVALQNNAKSIDIVILDNYHNFQIAYQKLDKSIDKYIIRENIKFKRGIFALVFLIFCLLVLCVVLIRRLINSYNTIEKQQAIKSLEVEYKERKRIAADLHDGLGSVLSSIALFIKLIEKDCTNENVNKSLIQVKELSGIALENLEAAINNLNPSNLTRYGLIQSLEIICDKINDIGKISCTVNSPDSEMRYDPNLEINIYRICNELINNTLKHSDASKLLIDIQQIKKTVVLLYRDNGKGFNPDLIYTNDEEKMGLHNIVNRIESFGGKYEINSGEGKGVEIILSFNI
jgi:signal transduction histidine kinase